MTVVDEVRSFNRFYTREIGLLDRHLPASALSLPEARVVYELAHAPGGERTAADMSRALKMDKAHLSRILARLRAQRLLTSRTKPEHGKHVLLALSEAGRAVFATMDQGTRAQMEALLGPVGPEERTRLVAAMREIRTVLGGEATADVVRLRPLRPGDLGWIAHRQAVLYHQEYGWDWTYEGLVMAILGQFVAGFDPAREEAWVGEHRGQVAGSVFLLKADDPATAKLRLLYVEPSARGLGLGRTLVQTCIARARALGYRTLTLWTNDILTAARRIYETEGFRLVSTAPHHSFGYDLVGQVWSLDLG